MHNKNRDLESYLMLQLAYKDYIASRFLINNNYILQGTYLASSSVEKYLKAIMISFGLQKNVHLDRVDEIRASFRSIGFDYLKNFDERFLSILGKSYKLRYYDRITHFDSLGMLVNQFLGELDCTVDRLDSLINLSVVDDKSNKPIENNEIISPYRNAIANKVKDLFENNYLLNNIEKKVFMEKPSPVFILHVDKSLNIPTYEFQIRDGSVSVKEYKSEINLAIVNVNKSNDEIQIQVSWVDEVNKA